MKKLTKKQKECVELIPNKCLIFAPVRERPVPILIYWDQFEKLTFSKDPYFKLYLVIHRIN